MNHKKATVNILGVEISLDSKSRVLEKINYFLENGRQHFIVTPNPEIILKARNNDEYKKILNQADIAVADGVGIKLAGFSFLKNIPRITGADLLVDILKIAESKNRKVLILNWKNSLSDLNKIEGMVIKKFPRLSFKAIASEREGAENILSAINDFSPHILFVGFGAPFQEIFISQNLKLLPAASLAIGVGGAFDFLAGSIKRAPKLIRYFGLEWLFRIFQEKGRRKFWRLKRICRATFVFSWQFIKWRIFNKKTHENQL